MKQKLLKSIGRAIPMLLFSMLLCTAAFAQRPITGKVVAANGQPVSGATVAVKGSNLATSTAPDGSFALSVPNDRSTLVVTYVGFDGIEVPITGLSTVSITLKERTSSLNEVVVTGYTSQAKKDITGSVAVVNTTDLKSIPQASAEAQLQGRAAGVNVTIDNRPGAGANVRIRGFASFGDNQPLYIIDGVPTGGLNGINPNDIETMQVLKDAASASIYGARASNGVIIVTTKRGRQGSAKVAFNMYYGTQNPAQGFNLLNSQEMADLTFKSFRNANQPTPTTQYGSGANPVLPDYILPAGKFEGDPAVNPDLYNLDLNNINGSYLIHRANKEGTNWYDEITRNAPIQNYNLAVSGGSNKSRYMMSLDYFDQQAVIINSFFKRYTLRVNTEFNVKENIRIGQNLQVLVSENNSVQNNGNNGEGTEIGFAYRNQPIIPVYDIKGNFAGSRAPTLGNSANPVAIAQRNKDNRGQNTSVFGNVYAEVDFLKHFTARSSFGGQMDYGNYFFFGFKTYENSENNTGNTYTEGFNRFRSWTWTNTLAYKNTFKDKHDVQALIGTEAIEEWGRNIEGRRANYFIEDLNFRALNSGGASGQVASGGPYTPAALFSIFGSVNYTFNDKYLASFTLRRDGSSRFGPNNRYGVFPSAAVGWRISREDFMRDVKWITDLKLRASWGQLGNQRINPGNAFDQYLGGPGSSNYDLNGSSNSTIQGFQLSFVGNPDGKWETNETINVGFDATLFGGKTEVVFDWYQKKTKDLLFRLAGFAYQGAGPVSNPAFVNVAGMNNTGIDLMVTQRALIGGTKGVNLSGTLTFTTYKNEITELAEGIDFFETRGSRIGNFVRNAVGQPISSFFGYKVIGLFADAADVTKSPTQDAAAPGRFKYADIAGNPDGTPDGRITDADRTFLGSPNPDFSYGLQLNGAWKGFDVGVFFYGVQGKEAMNYVKWWTDFFPSFQGNKSKDLLYNSWTPTNLGAKTPIAENLSNFSNNNAVNSYYLEDASFFRLKNLTVGYTLPAAITNKVKIDKARIYFQTTNLFTITKYTGLDPELIGADDAGGVDEGIYPTVKQFLFGVNINF
jgi:TonB-linked SusC/RagA family outer membrane protein